MGDRMAVEVVGREEELARCLRSSTGTRQGQGPRALALEGEAGIGKSTLWHAGVEDARGRGLRVLSTRPAESERGLAYAGLGDLLDGVLDDVLPSLTPPRRRALEVALLVEDAAGRAGRPARARRRRAERARAARRRRARRSRSTTSSGSMPRRPARSASRCAGCPTPDPAALDAAAAASQSSRRRSRTRSTRDRIERVRVGPLSVGATHQVLRACSPAACRGRRCCGCTRSRAGTRSTRSSWRARSAPRARSDPTQPLPVPERLEELVSARLDGFRGVDARGARARVRACAPDAGPARRRGNRARTRSTRRSAST